MKTLFQSFIASFLLLCLVVTAWGQSAPALPISLVVPPLRTSPRANAEILAIQALDSMNVYIAGDFTSQQGYRYVARWDGKSWGEVGGGSAALKANGAISTMYVLSANNIYVAGEFTDSLGRYYLAHWNGTQWQSVGNLGANGAILAFEYVSNTEIYVAGKFTNSAGDYVVAKWNGSIWTELGAGLNANAPIYALERGMNKQVYAGGDFVDTAYRRYVACWNGSQWQPLAAGLHTVANNGRIEWIKETGTNAVSVGGKAMGSAHWNGSTWTLTSVLGVSTIDVFNNKKYFTYDVFKFNEYQILNIHDITNPTTVYPGIHTGGIITGLFVISSTEMYAVGSNIRDELGYYVVKWDGKRWHPICQEKKLELGPYLDSYQFGGPLAVESDSNIFAYLSNMGLMHWNGTTWEHTGIPHKSIDMVGELVIHTPTDASLMGVLTDSTTQNTTSCLLSWNGIKWSIADSTFPVNSLGGSTKMFSGNDIYRWDSVTSNIIQHWNGTQWSAITHGLTSAMRIYSLSIISATNIYASIRGFGGSTYQLIHWDGNAWSALTGTQTLPLNAPIYLLHAVSDTEIYTHANSSLGIGLMKWNGTKWGFLDSTTTLGSQYEVLNKMQYFSSSEIYFSFGNKNSTYFTNTQLWKWDGVKLQQILASSYATFKVAKSRNIYFTKINAYDKEFQPCVYRALVQPICQPPIIFAMPKMHPMCAGETLLLHATVQQADQLQWQDSTASGWANIANATSSTLLYGSMSAALHGRKIRLVAYNSCNHSSDTSAAQTLQFAAQLAPSLQIVGNTMLCEGDTTHFVAVGTYAGNSPTYTWWRNNTFVGTGAQYATILHSGDKIAATLNSSLSCAASTPVQSNTLTAIVTPAAQNPTIQIDGQKASCTIAKPYYSYHWYMYKSSSDNFPTEYTTTVPFTNMGTGTVKIGLRLIDFLGCMDSVSSKIIVLVSSDNTAEQIFTHVYPNPVQDILTLQLPTNDILQITGQLFDMKGELLHEAVLSRLPNDLFQWDTANLSSGIYLLQISSGNRTWQVKFVK